MICVEFERNHLTGGWREWLVVEQGAKYVSIHVDYWSPNSKKRSTWMDSGVCIEFEHLSGVIEALTKVRDALLHGTEQKP